MRLIGDRLNNLRSIFHIVIIAGILLSLSGCGYKGDPYYDDAKVPQNKNKKMIKSGER